MSFSRADLLTTGAVCLAIGAASSLFLSRVLKPSEDIKQIEKEIADDGVSSEDTNAQTGPDFDDFDEDEIDDDEPVVMAILLRSDMRLTSSRAALYSSEASIGGFRECLQTDPTSVKNWRIQGERKIFLKARDDEDILSLCDEADAAGISTHIVFADEETHLPIGTVLAAAIGPGSEETIVEICGHLRSL